MDLRGSSSSLASGLRVSAIPPAPMCWPMAVDRVIWVEGAKAEAEATRAAMTASLYCNDGDTRRITKVSICFQSNRHGTGCELPPMNVVRA